MIPPAQPFLSLRERWPLALKWLALLAPLFFASYSFANWFTGQRGDVGSLVFAWEQGMPFWAWTIVPYWSIDALYGLSLLLCTTRHEMHVHARRLLTAQAIAVTGFLLFPLHYTFTRPATDGFFGWMFTVLMGFDKPYNQAPSLHIVLLVVLWVRYAAHVSSGWARGLLHVWFALIGLSVLTTYQHHFIDLPTGILAGWLCVWLWPMARPGHVATGWKPQKKGRRLAVCYSAGALLCIGLVIHFRGAWLWLLWPALACLLVAWCYVRLGPHGWQKQADGRLSSAAKGLFGPYLVGAWLNSRLWTARHPQPTLVIEGVWLGRIPGKRDLSGSPVTAIVDLCAELPCYVGTRAYESVPCLDLLPPSPATLREAALAIERFRHAEHEVLVCCALGYSRSASAVAAWLLHFGHAPNPEAAAALIRQAKPHVVLRQGHLDNLRRMQALP